MEKKKTFFLSFALMILMICFVDTGTAVTGDVSEKSPDFKPVADEVVGSSVITWVPKVNYSRLVLTLSRPDGTVIEKSFESGTSPFIDLSSLNGDGSYIYELRVIPFPVKMFRKNLEKAGDSAPRQKTLTQSGSFSVRDGGIVTRGVSEEISRTNDVLHYDDVIITGSLCVGFDCQDGESFGFDTIILKEHNLRIYFNDTSYTASYPTNNWRITINDSTNGGASYFSVDDVDDGTSIFKIEAGAPSNSLYVEDYGRVGLGTSTPVVELHIKDSDTPTLRLEQDSSGGWTAQTFDVAGNESNFFIRDATNGSKLPFRIQPSTPSSTLCLKSDGKVGIGTWSPAYPLELETTGENAEFLMERTSGAQAQMGAASTLAYFGARTDHEVRFQVNSDWRMRLNPTSDSSILEMTDGGYYDGSWHGSSSREVKENIRGLTVDEAVEALQGLNPVKFYYKRNKEDEHVGFIAEDVPDLVASQNRKALSAMDVAAVLTKVVKEQQKTVQAQQQFLQKQQKMMQEQQKIITQLKNEIAELKKK